MSMFKEFSNRRQADADSAVASSSDFASGAGDADEDDDSLGKRIGVVKDSSSANWLAL